MRKVTIITLLTTGMLGIWAGCETSGRNQGAAADAQNPASTGQSVEQDRSHPEWVDSGSVPSARLDSKSAKQVLAAARNPTTLAGRGLPDLDDQNRPAAWIYVDGQTGRFTQRDGEWQMQWVIDGPVSPAPTFRVEVYEPLLGSPKDFSCVLQTVEAADGSVIVYGMTAEEGRFQPGRQYPLLSPGDGFVIRVITTGKVVSEIASLSPGTYVLAAGIANADTGKEGLAVTYFTVGDGQ